MAKAASNSSPRGGVAANKTRRAPATGRAHATRHWLAPGSLAKVALAVVALAVVALAVVGAPAGRVGAVRADEPEISPALAKIFAGENPQTVQDLKAMEDHLRGMVEKVTPAVVGVRVGQAQGSGVIVSKDGVVLTAAHVNGRVNLDAVLILPDGRQLRAKTLGMNRGVDSGMLKITEQGEWPFVEMAEPDAIKTGQWCFAVGHPGGYERDRKPVLRLGRVLSTRSTVLTTDCTLVGGDSGGPLFDMSGKVIGIHSRIAGPLTANMHVPVSQFRGEWDRLVAGEAWGSLPGETPYLGVLGDQASSEAKISEVKPKSPAEKAGLKPGDVIISFDGKEIKDFTGLSALVKDKAPGDKVTIEYRRDGGTRKVELVIGKREG